MELVINPQDYIHIEELSVYNHNYYRNIHDNSILLEEMDDDDPQVRYESYDEETRRTDYIGCRWDGGEFFPFNPIAFPEDNIPFELDTETFG